MIKRGKTGLHRINPCDFFIKYAVVLLNNWKIPDPVATIFLLAYYCSVFSIFSKKVHLFSGSKILLWSSCFGSLPIQIFEINHF